MRCYAIGDVHGELDKLEAVHRLIRADRVRMRDAVAPAVHVGDLCDRGPDTKGVLDFLLAGRDRGEPWVVLKGNHEAMMSDFLDGGPGSAWLIPQNGGPATLASYGVAGLGVVQHDALREAARARIPERHRDFLRALPASFRQGDLYVCHAGIRPGVPLDAQREQDLLWIRDPFLMSTADHGPLIVHGHTPVDAVTHYGNRLAIDTGAGYGRALSAVAIEGRRAWLLTDTGRVAVDPV